MAYIGKEFKLEKQENYEEFINALAAFEEKAKSFLSFQPTHTILKNGDEYTFVINVKEANIKKEISFKSGVAFDEDLPGGIKAKSVVTVDGDTYTQVQDVGTGTITMKREYTADSLKVTVSSSLVSITAQRYYVPA